MYCTANKNENEIIHSVNLTKTENIQLYSAIIFYHVQPVSSITRYVCSNFMAVST